MNRNRRPVRSVAAVTTVATVPKTPLPSPFAKEPSFATVAKQGFSWGIGNALAHTVINRMIGPAPASAPGPVKPSTGQTAGPKQIAYTQCVKDFGDAESCKHLLD